MLDCLVVYLARACLNSSGVRCVSSRVSSNVMDFLRCMVKKAVLKPLLKPLLNPSERRVLLCNLSLNSVNTILYTSPFSFTRISLRKSSSRAMSTEFGDGFKSVGFIKCRKNLLS